MGWKPENMGKSLIRRRSLKFKRDWNGEEEGSQKHIEKK